MLDEMMFAVLGGLGTVLLVLANMMSTRPPTQQNQPMRIEEQGRRHGL